MKRLAITAALVLAAVLTQTNDAQASAPCGGRTVKATIWCAVNHYGGVPGGVHYAVSIAWRESRFHADAVSYNGCCVGIYQWHHTTWAGLLTSWPEMNELYGRSRTNMRGNIMRAIRTAHETGWDPWRL